MALDFSSIDDELQRRGIDPQAAARLLNFGAAQPKPADAMAEAAAAARPRVPRLNFAQPTPPEMPTMPTQAPQLLNFGQGGGPTAPAEASRLNFGGDSTAAKAQPDPNKSATSGMSAGQMMATVRGNSGVNNAPAYTPGPAEKRFEDMEAKGGPQLHGWKKWLDIAGQIAVPGVEMAIPGTPGNFNVRLMRAARQATEEQRLRKGDQELDTSAAQAQFNTPEKRRTYMQQNPDLFEDVSDFQKHDWVLSGKFPQREPAPKTERPENLDREAYDYYVGQGMSPADARKRVLQDAQSVKPERQAHTSPFEAFAYGSPEEKKAAQDYLEFEKRMGARYRTPNEFEEKYRLWKEDPDAYKSMFGDKGGAGPDRATATRMLNYFDRRRREIQQDFTLDDTQKQEQLKDIENLEKPFMNAVQLGNRGGSEDRVTVIHPNGQVGSIPRSQLDKAKKKGYREAPQQ